MIHKFLETHNSLLDWNNTFFLQSIYQPAQIYNLTIYNYITKISITYFFVDYKSQLNSQYINIL